MTEPTVDAVAEQADVRELASRLRIVERQNEELDAHLEAARAQVNTLREDRDRLGILASRLAILRYHTTTPDGLRAEMERLISMQLPLLSIRTGALAAVRLEEIRDCQLGDWYQAPWDTAFVEGDGEADPSYWKVVERESGHVVATLPDWAGGIALWIADSREAVPELLAEVDRLTLEGELTVTDVDPDEAGVPV
ncbi:MULTISPECIES: hypothetical protein [unclassified Streptomyces]|uniref:hypothetical protein n=1 Tax=unclassified Streptomyces TaxID=2593676 RepID=UPI0033E84123